MNEPPTAERPEQGALPEQKEVDSADEPRIYVASLSDYNAGRLHGAWINANQEAEELQAAINTMLAKSREPVAEEWAIHDYEGFGPLPIGEYEGIEQVARIARGIAEHGKGFAHWASYLDRIQWDEYLERFEHNYLGQWNSLTEFAESMLEDMGMDISSLIDEQWQPYVSFDVEAFARDLSYDFHVSEGDNGVYVFDNT